MLKKLAYYLFSILILLNSVANSSFASSFNEKLKKGEVIIEDNVSQEAKVGSVKMTFMVSAPVEKIWKLLIEYDKWPSFMQDLDKVVIRESKEHYAIVYVKAKAPLGMDISYVLRRVYDKEKYKITWTMLEGKAKDVQGSWQIFPVNNNLCRVVYTNYVDVGFMVPEKIVSMLTKRKLPDLANGIKNYLKNN